jgi:hypothetical protein
MTNNIYYSIYRVDEENNLQLVCGASSQQVAEEMLRKHPGFENAKVRWNSSIVYGQPGASSVKMGVIENA